mgnify:CR=1 FL=1
MATAAFDPIRKARRQECRSQLKLLAWVLGLVALLVVLRILAGPGCDC